MQQNELEEASSTDSWQKIHMPEFGINDEQ